MATTIDAPFLSPALNDFDPVLRTQALLDYAAKTDPARTLPPNDVANMHCHSFFSYNALGMSPSALAVMARDQAIGLLGLVDFDVIDGVDEFLDACELLAVRGGASIETRVYVPEFADREINSPGEPGVLYHMGTGFVTSHVPAAVAPVLEDLAGRARQRNVALVARVNAHLAPITVDYERDVLPLTPQGNATERHIVAAYINAVAGQTADPAGFWGERLGVAAAHVDAAMRTDYGLANLVRKALMKKGGAAYVAPGPDTFPKVEQFHEFVIGCGGIPCVTWLDGTSPGEQALPELIQLLVAKGAATFNIIPDRNWNITDPKTKEIKVRNLYAAVEMAADNALPILVGTEMNSPGQPLVDQFDAPELAPVRDIFLDGAHFLYGHTMLARHGHFGYTGEWAGAHFGNRRDANAFYTAVGRALPPGDTGVRMVKRLAPDASPADILGAFTQ